MYRTHRRTMILLGLGHFATILNVVNTRVGGDKPLVTLVSYLHWLRHQGGVPVPMGRDGWQRPGTPPPSVSVHGPPLFFGFVEKPSQTLTKGWKATVTDHMWFFLKTGVRS